MGTVVLVLRPPILDRDILALDVAGFTNALPECGQKTCTIGRRPRAAEEPDDRHGRLLRAHRNRPRRGRAADKRDELAPFQLIEVHPIPHEGGTARRRISNLQGSVSGYRGAFRNRNQSADSRSVVGHKQTSRRP
jgi:hypothetical protein